ncbi:hypothetical protein ACIRPK_22435 [Kitasatospora sp. NPDC101801]|uniref:hypothetical protein n=1 Tax=Kitasatospora sp. NPDC101801 TaxID=3364103 RepID=UPI003809756E
MAGAFERTATALRARVRDSGYAGAATFDVWHDEVTGQLRCSTGTVSPEGLSFGGTYIPTTDLGPAVAGFRVDDSPGGDRHHRRRFEDDSDGHPDRRCQGW